MGKSWYKHNKVRKKRAINIYNLLMIFMVVTMVCSLVYTTYNSAKPAEADLKYIEFMDRVDSGDVDKVSIIDGRDIMQVYLENGETYNVINPKSEDFKKELLEKGVEITVSKQSFVDALTGVLVTLPTLILTLVFVLFLVKSMKSSVNTLFKILKDNEVTTFDQVAGMDEVKDEVQFAVDILNNYKELDRAGARPTKGILLEGPPGTGKTMIARAIAGEAKVPIISTCGSDFIEMFVGLGAARVRALYSLAEANAPCVVFIDEIDAIGKRRSGNVGNTEGNQTLNALLQKMDGLGDNSGILVVAATNLASELDPALIRPGRFDKKITVTPPRTKASRDAIINVHIKNKTLESGIDRDKMSKLMFGLTGAEIESVLNESAILSVREGRHGVISLSDIDKSVMKLLAAGVVVNNYTEADKRIAAVHESGHAIMNKVLGRGVSKVSIEAYSSGLGGITIADVDIEKNQFSTESSLNGDIQVLLAGMIAEELILGEHSAGCSNDLERATNISRAMIGRYGMGDNMLVSIDTISNDIIQSDNKIYLEMVNSKLVETGEIVRGILGSKVDEINSLADRLLKEETVLDYN